MLTGIPVALVKVTHKMKGEGKMKEEESTQHAIWIMEEAIKWLKGDRNERPWTNDCDAMKMILDSLCCWTK